MKRYLIIAIAILAGLLTMAIINRLAGDTSEKGGIQKGHIIGGIVSFVALMLGLFMVEMGAAAPSSDYVPAKLIDGKIVAPEFVDKNEFVDKK